MKGYKMGYYEFAYGEYEDKMNKGYLLSATESTQLLAKYEAEEKAHIAALKAMFFKKYQGKF